MLTSSLEYYANHNFLLAATLGRGMWGINMRVRRTPSTHVSPMVVEPVKIQKNPRPDSRPVHDEL